MWAHPDHVEALTKLIELNGDIPHITIKMLMHARRNNIFLTPASVAAMRDKV